MLSYFPVMLKFMLLNLTCLWYDKPHKRGSAKHPDVGLNSVRGHADFLFEKPTALPQFPLGLPSKW